MRAGALALLLAAGCTQTYYLDMKNIDLDAPDDIETRLASFRSGREPWHGDPRAVADAAIRRHLDVPWKADPYRPGDYDLREDAKSGVHVVRGYVYPSGHEMRYRVKVRPYREIWYPVQVSHYKIHELPHPALEKSPDDL